MSVAKALPSWLRPQEHGAWGMLSTAVIAALLVAPSPIAALVAIACLAGLPVRQAAQVWQRRGHLPTGLRWLALLLALMLGGAIGLVLSDWTARCAALSAIVLALAALLAGGSRVRPARGRSLPALLLGICSLVLTATTVALVGGLPTTTAVLFAALLVAQHSLTALFVRGRIRLDRNQGATGLVAATRLGHFATTVILAAATPALPALLPLLVAWVLLTARCWLGLRPASGAMPITQLGRREVGWGAIATGALVWSLLIMP